jgi:hypothetical protein
LLAVALLCFLGVAGCGPKLYPVRGQVTYPDGKPLTEGTVVFESVVEENRVTARGQIDRDGRYELSTYQRGDGVPAGKYRVAVAPKLDPNAVDKRSNPLAFDRRYTEFKTSGLEFEVESGRNEYPIKVTRPGNTRR